MRGDAITNYGKLTMTVEEAATSEIDGDRENLVVMILLLRDEVAP